jgi:hypothetical protein
MGTRHLWGNIEFFLTSPSRFKVRLMVLSEWNGSPSFRNSHLMAETPICANGADSRRFLVEIMSSFSVVPSSDGRVSAALECSLYQSVAPD